MSKRGLWASIIIFVGLVGGLLGVNLGTDNTPVLGLDLQGGFSVIYATEEPADDEQLIIVRDLMRGQLESFGIAEPDVRVEGENVIVDLPGVSDQEAAFEALQVSGIVTLRPVIQCQAGVIDTGSADGPTGSSVPATTATTTAPTTAPTDTVDETVDEESLAPAGFAEIGFRSPATPDTTQPDTTEPETTEPDTTEPVATVPPAPIDDGGQDLLPYPGTQSSCLVGPTVEGGTGEVFAQGSASPNIDPSTGQWVTNVDLRPDGQVVWNNLAQMCFNGAGDCPSRQLAIVLDDVIQSAPTVQTPSFPGSVQISGAFTEDEVRSLSRVLNRGAFPVAVEIQRQENVSATAGQDSLNAALIAGLIGVVAVLAFMVAYYRKLSVVIIAGLLVWGMTVFSLATFVSQATNYALTLAGATGIIVAVGVTVDTYVVFFERLKDEVRHGRSIRNAAPRSFQATWRTIVSADLVSLMASLILFWLSVGSVKGFALYLGLTTICDLLVCYFFTRPAVYLLSMTNWFDDNATGDNTMGTIGATA